MKTFTLTQIARHKIGQFNCAARFRTLVLAVFAAAMTITATATPNETPDDIRITSQQVLGGEHMLLRWMHGNAPFTIQASADIGANASWVDVLTTHSRTATFANKSGWKYFRVRGSRSASPKSPSVYTRAINAAVLAELPFSNRQDYMDATNGLIGVPTSNITNANGDIIRNFHQYDFLQTNAPSSVNPSLWRQAQLNSAYGLFKVVEGIYQIRGFDLANITLVEGDTGWIVIDTLTCEETARAGMDLVRATLGDRPVKAVIYTHSHVDHFGGVKGIISQADVDSNKVEVIAPQGFMDSAVSENVYAGNAMSRRASYMYGPLLPSGPLGQVDNGLGNQLVAGGAITLIPPTVTISQTGQELTVDGVQIIFQYVPGTEAPAEMMFYFPKYRALCLAEDATHTLHNLYSLRGAQVRDGLAWAKDLNDTIQLFGDKTDVAFASHHWPTWGNDRVLTFLTKQRDLFKFIHDQSLRLLNEGYTPIEIAEQLRLPPSLAQEFYNRGYYGTVNHDAKAVYQRYLGWFDGNPANLHLLPPVEAGKKYVDALGGSQAVLARARKAYQAGEYRWVAELVNHVVFAEPDNAAARQLQADALEQLGYQAESGPWRNFYLTGAQELRDGVPDLPNITTASPDMVAAMSTEAFFDYLAAHLNGVKATGQTITLNWDLTDTGDQYLMKLENSVLNYTKGEQSANADVTISLSRQTLNDVLSGSDSILADILSGKIQITGNQLKLIQLVLLMDSYPTFFNIVTP